MGKNKGRASQGYVSAPPAQVTARKRAQRESNTKGVSTGFTIVMLIGVAIYLFAFGGLEELQNLFAPEDDLVFEFTNATFNQTFGREGDYIQLGFLVEVDDPAVDTAFLNAAARWSDIVRGTPYPRPGGFFRQAGEPLCTGVDTGFTEDITFNELVIVVTFEELPPGVLGSAGPCFFDTFNGNVRPLTGQMSFSSTRTAELVQDGSFESVVLHEMGHVLGIGTMWEFNNLLFNPVFGNTINLNNQPENRGASALAQYRNLINDQAETFVPVEDGVFNGVEQFDRAAGRGQGSIDGHWDKDSFQGELMEFQIAPGATPPMSAVSIATLEDMGYTVNLTFAQAYTPTPLSNSLVQASGNLRASKKDYITLLGDIDLSHMEEV